MKKKNTSMLHTLLYNCLLFSALVACNPHTPNTQTQKDVLHKFFLMNTIAHDQMGNKDIAWHINHELFNHYKQNHAPNNTPTNIPYFNAPNIIKSGLLWGSI